MWNPQLKRIYFVFVFKPKKILGFKKILVEKSNFYSKMILLLYYFLAYQSKPNKSKLVKPTTKPNPQKPQHWIFEQNFSFCLYHIFSISLTMFLARATGATSGLTVCQFVHFSKLTLGDLEIMCGDEILHF